MSVHFPRWVPRNAHRALLALPLAVLLLPGPASGSVANLPVISYTIDGIGGTNGWYRGSSGGNYVVLHWQVTGADNTDCTFAVKINGPTKGTTRSCSASNSAGPVSATTTAIGIDADPPTDVVATAARPTDAGGWYNHAVGVAWHGSDATSGIATCTSLTYAGPDPTATLSGSCTDLAGNTSTAPFAVNFDATPPSLSVLTVQSEDGRNVVIWKSSSTTDVAVIERSVRGHKAQTVFDAAGSKFVDTKIRDGVEYRYVVKTYDEAANPSLPRAVLALPKVVTLASAGARTARVPILSWPAVRRAGYYHVQLFRKGRRILAAWPLKAELALHSHWKWNGRRYGLTPGRYVWYAWAGFGPRRATRYRAVGHSVFVVPSRADG